ncbi:hypothetical protein [Ligilactobacillus salivarius]|uniref:hypothetical protein n=1 Tax=Ligilactobacillus salivarius TaxID=1624 RepID=UPI0009D9C764|nr:hypothetical protein [Ligilactobacillus salivarius]OQR18777.1 hypothetical protein B6U39_09215 [Ligilactobacillus salivarius]
MGIFKWLKERKAEKEKKKEIARQEAIKHCTLTDIEIDMDHLRIPEYQLKRLLEKKNDRKE